MPDASPTPPSVFVLLRRLREEIQLLETELYKSMDADVVQRHAASAGALIGDIREQVLRGPPS